MIGLDRVNARRLVGLAEFSVFAACSIFVFATALGSRLNHNEHMYVAAARLWWELRLYEDYAFLQAPLLPMVNGVLFRLAGQDHLLVIARLHVAFWALGAIGAVHAIARQFEPGARAVGLSAALAVASHPLFLKNVSESSNYMMSVALALLALLAQVLAVRESDRRALYAAASGFTIGLAVSCKSYNAVLAAGLLAISWWIGGRRLLVPWLLGFGAGLLPLAYYALRDPTTFYFGNLGYHVANAEYRRVSGSNLAMTLTDKLEYAGERWRDPVLIAVTIYAGIGLAFSKRLAGENSCARTLCVIAAVLFALACVAALVPTPVFIQYFGMPFVFLVVFGVAVASLRDGWWRRGFIAICLVGLVHALATHLLEFSLSRDSVAGRLEQEAAKLDAVIGCSGETYVATLSPIVALEAGCAIYPELASGPFGFRVADLHAPDSQERLRIVGPRRLAEFLDSQRPNAILVGFEPSHDLAFESYARSRGYAQHHARILRRGRLWLSSATAERAAPPTAED